MLGLWLALRARPSMQSAAASGLLVGLASLALATQLLLLPAVVWAHWRNRSQALLAAGICLLAILPATLHNRSRSGEWIPISANAGVNLWIGNSPDSDRLTALRPGKQWEDLVNEPIARGASSPAEADRYFVKKARDWCLGSPLSCAGGLLHKARLLLAARDLPRNEDVYLLKQGSPVLAPLLARAGSLALPWILILPLAIAGAVAAFRSRKRSPLGLLLATCALCLGPILFFVTGRYRAPIAPLFCALAALAIPALRERARAPIVACGFTLLLAALPVSTASDEVDFEAEMHYAVAGRRARLGDPAGAIRAWERALERRPDYLEARVNLALLLDERDEPRQAAEHYAYLLAARPEDDELRFRRAVALLVSEQIDEAERELTLLLERQPTHPGALRGMVQVFLLRGDARSAHAYAVRADEAAGGRDAQAAALRRRIEAAIGRD
jgi:tetratricopeptide (TPR) repeat protein